MSGLCSNLLCVTSGRSILCVCVSGRSSAKIFCSKPKCTFHLPWVLGFQTFMHQCFSALCQIWMAGSPPASRLSTMVWAPSASWGLCWCLLADALQRDCELISSDYHSAAQFSCRILVLFLFFLLPDLDDLDVGSKSVKSGI